MGTCPLSGNECIELKKFSINEVIDGKSENFNICEKCCGHYLTETTTKQEYLDFHTKNKELMSQEPSPIIQNKIRPIIFTEKIEENTFEKIKTKSKLILNKAKVLFNKGKNYFSKNKIEATNENKSSFTIKDLKNLFKKIKEDQEIDIDNENYEDAEKKEVIINEIKNNFTQIRQMQMQIAICVNNNDIESIRKIKNEIKKILKKYELFKF